MSNFFPTFSSFNLFPPRTGSFDINTNFDEHIRLEMERRLNPPPDPYLQNLLNSMIEETKTAPKAELSCFCSLTTEIPESATVIDQLATKVIPVATGTPFEASLLPPPIETFLEDTILKDAVGKQVASAMPFVPLSTTLIKAATQGITLIPFFLFALITSKERVLQNINVEISAGPQRKIYEIGFGKKNGEELSIALEIEAGHPIRFLRDKSAKITNTVNPIFKAKGFFSHLPLLKFFLWKRQLPETDCNITILDSGNPTLQKGPDVTYIPLSENEGFNIIHQDPTLIKNLTTDDRAYDKVETAEASGYTSLSSVSIKITDPINKSAKYRTQLIDLPFDNDDQTKVDTYLRVTQYS